MRPAGRREVLALVVLVLAGAALRPILGRVFALDGENFTDQVQYAAMARSVWREGTFEVNGEPSSLYPPLYPLVLAPGAALPGRDLEAFVWIGSLAMSAGLVPLWLVGRRFLGPGRLRVGLGVASILPSILLLPTQLFSEALFYPLFWTWIWAGLRLVEKPTAGRALAWGLVLGALVQTRTIGLALVPALILPALELGGTAPRGARLRRVGRGAALGLVALGAALLVQIPWESRNVRFHDAPVPGYAEPGALPAVVQEGPGRVARLAAGWARQLSHLEVGAAVLFVALALPVAGAAGSAGRHARLAFAATLLFSAASAYHHDLGHRAGSGIMIFGRYVAQVGPPLVLAGLAGLDRPRPVAFLVAGLGLVAFPFPVVRDLETRWLLPLYWLADSTWAVRGALLAATAGFAFLALSGRRRLALAGAVAWLLVADAHAVAYLHAIGLAHRPLAGFAREVARETEGGPVHVVGEAEGRAWSADDRRAVWALVHWGGLEVRQAPRGDERMRITPDPGREPPAGEWLVPRQSGDLWRVLHGLSRPTGQAESVAGQ